MRLCGPHVWGMRRDRGNAHRVLHRAFELGVNFIDTADNRPLQRALGVDPSCPWYLRRHLEASRKDAVAKDHTMIVVRSCVV